MKKLFSILFALVLVVSLTLVMAVPVAAATLNVPNPYPTIQAAVNAATAGDTINVAAGTYTEQVMVDKSVTLISDTGDYRTTGTILTGSGCFFTLPDGAHDITIQGFRFENIAVDDTGVAGGIYSGGVTTQKTSLLNLTAS